MRDPAADDTETGPISKILVRVRELAGKLKAPKCRVAFDGAFALFLIVFVGLYFYFGTHLIHETNQDRLNWDQQHNITLAFKALERESQPADETEGVTGVLWRQFPHFTDGIVNPLWPWIAARFADEDHERFFEKGKWFNLTLTAAFLVIVGIVTARAFSRLSAVTILLLGGFGAVLPRAPFFQPEAVYYILFFLSWICALSLFRRNTLWHYGILGFLLGLTYLAKSSVQPFLLVFIGVTCLRSVVEWWLNRKNRGRGDPQWSQANQLIGLAVLAVTFLVSAGPRLNYASGFYGNPFHSYPGYWMWMEDFEKEGKEFMEKYGDRESLEKMPPEEKPSLANYLKKNGWNAFSERLRKGTGKKWKELMAPGEKLKAGRTILLQRGTLLLLLTGLLAAISIIHVVATRKRDQLIWPVGPQSARWMLLFAFGTFALSLLAYGFYEPIGKGDRFMLSLFLPMVVTVIWIAERFRRQLQRTPFAELATGLMGLVHVIVIVLVAFRVAALLGDPVFVGKP